MILHLWQLPVNQTLSAFSVTSQDVCPPSVKLNSVLPAGFPIAIINTSVDGQWTFCIGHFNKTEQCLRCISQWETFSWVFYKFSHSPSECWRPLRKKHEQEAFHYHHNAEFWSILYIKIYISAWNVLPPSVTRTHWEFREIDFSLFSTFTSSIWHFSRYLASRFAPSPSPSSLSLYSKGTGHF